MADTKLHDLAELTAPDPLDELEIIDRSDTSMDADGTNMRIKVQTLQVLMAQAGELPPTGVTLQNTSRSAAISQTVTPASGTLRMGAIWLPAGFTVTSLSHASVGALALGTSPHYWVALFDSSRNLLGQSTDDTATSWGANALKTTNLTTPFVTTYTGPHYGAFMFAMTGGTMPTLPAIQGTAGLNALAPILGGVSTTSLTTTAPNPAAAITGATNLHWFGVA